MKDATLMNTILRSRAIQVVLIATQVIFLMMAGYGLAQIEKVVMDFKSPTPTCPQGRNIMLLSIETREKCVDEAINIYLPLWVHPFTRLALVGSTLWLLAGALNWRLNRHSKGGVTFFVQLGLCCLFHFLYTYLFTVWYIPDMIQLMLGNYP